MYASLVDMSKFPRKIWRLTLYLNQRETDTLSTVSQSLQTLRTSFAQQSQTIARLETRNRDLDRQLALSGAQEQAARATLRSAETRAKALREELARFKGTVAQIRAQCANDIRRRDGEIQKLKRSIEARRGRDGNGGQAGVVIVKPGAYKGEQESRLLENEVDLESPNYSLKQETTEFLTQLIHGLSDENDTLIELVKSTLETLRSLQGLPNDSTLALDQSENAGLGSDDKMLAPPPSYEDLAANTEEVLEHLRGLLTNPSFVPLEEVEIRENEIIRLREGWEKMEARWKDAVALMDGWRKRMVNTGDTINLEDLRIGLNLGFETLPSFPLGEEGSEPRPESVDEDGSGSQSFDEAQGEIDGRSEVHIIDDLSADELDLPAAPTNPVLTSRSPNARPKLSPRKSAFSPIPEESTRQLRDAEQGFSPFRVSPHKPQPSPGKPKTRTKQQVRHICVQTSFFPSASSLQL